MIFVDTSFCIALGTTRDNEHSAAVRLLARNRFDNLAKISQCSGPIFFAHGTADDLNG